MSRLYGLGMKYFIITFLTLIHFQVRADNDLTKTYRKVVKFGEGRVEANRELINSVLDTHVGETELSGAGAPLVNRAEVGAKLFTEFEFTFRSWENGVTDVPTAKEFEHIFVGKLAAANFEWQDVSFIRNENGDNLLHLALQLAQESELNHHLARESKIALPPLSDSKVFSGYRFVVEFLCRNSNLAALANVEGDTPVDFLLSTDYRSEFLLKLVAENDRSGSAKEKISAASPQN